MLRMQDVTVTFPSGRALDGFSLEVPTGSVVAVMGPSGCGKSTALRSIIRLVEPNSGQVTWMGEDVTAMSQSQLERFRRGVGLVFQRSNLISRLNVVRNVMLPMVAVGKSVDEAHDLSMRALAEVGMDSRADEDVRGLSGGEMQRVAIARAIADHPSLILWDEPTASLDPTLVVDVLSLMERLSRTLEATMVVVTHEIGFALRAAHNIVLMEAGAVVEQGAPDAVLANPLSDVGRRYARALAYAAAPLKENVAAL
ncbi:MAG: putative amino-acid import ATP-binding protein YxeO [Firmicutes bacterium ADurb.Bin506]|jgi:polar amino acid transport system ATP-binding protein|nr:MAG: putative amino-acid import ATP-binding protein YxeO [Firmicutes bacterium ADurb.Bin506]